MLVVRVPGRSYHHFVNIILNLSPFIIQFRKEGKRRSTESTENDEDDDDLGGSPDTGDGVRVERMTNGDISLTGECQYR